MRIFEAALILVNLLALLLSFKKQSQVVWLRMAGINLLIFLVHGLFDGLRYQMIFSYLLVVLFTIIALAKTNDTRHKIKIPRILKVFMLGLSVLSLGLTSFLAYALPVFILPQPTGNDGIGIQYFHLMDESRTEPFLNTSAKKRELMVKVYYPAQKDASKPFSSYFHNSPELIKSFTAFYNLPDFTFDHLNLVKTNSKEDLPLSDRQPRYPVVLFSHGAGTSMEVQTSQSEDLASHGYIVVAIDHTYVSAATLFPDRIVSHKEATANFNVPEPAEIITQIMADDASFVIDKLGEMNDGKVDSIFEGKFDLENIGAIGHSVGGAVAYNLAINDSRVKAAVDLDGVVFITPQSAANVSPFLMLTNDQYHIQAIVARQPLMKPFEEMDEIDQKITMEIYGNEDVYKQAYSKAQQNVIALTKVLQESENLFTIAGSDHMKFTDIGLFIGVPQLRELINIRGETEPARCLEITKALTLAFFDQHLKDEPSDSLESVIAAYPELKNVLLK